MAWRAVTCLLPLMEPSRGVHTGSPPLLVSTPSCSAASQPTSPPSYCGRGGGSLAQQRPRSVQVAAIKCLIARPEPCPGPALCADRPTRGPPLPSPSIPSPKGMMAACSSRGEERRGEGQADVTVGLGRLFARRLCMSPVVAVCGPRWQLPSLRPRSPAPPRAAASSGTRLRPR